MEMLIPEFPEPARGANSRGGLGILAGDIAAGLKRAGIPAIGIIPLYNRSWVDSREVSYDGLPIQCVMELNLAINGQHTPIKVLEINRAGTPVFGLINGAFNYLYVHDRWDRLQQEVIFGNAAPMLLKALGIKPDIVWFNESHTAVAAATMRDDPYFDETKMLFTIHTPDPAGMEKFSPDWFSQMGINAERYYPIFVRDGVIDFTQALMVLADRVSPVSREHGYITRKNFPQFSSKIVEGIRNGSDRILWLSPRIRRRKGKLDPFRLWTIHQEDKHDLLDLAKESTRVRLDPRKPLIVWVRRIVPYKNQYPMLEPIIKAICAERDETVETPFGILQGLGMQMFAAGIPAYGDSYCHDWVEKFYKWMEDPQLQGKFVFLLDYSFKLLRKGAAGCDVWLATPWPGWEACGTGDMRSTENGNLVLTSETGGSKEYMRGYDPKRLSGNGFFINPYDPSTLYRRLRTISDLYYAWIESGNRRWPELRMNVFRTGETLDIVPMIERYNDEIFRPLLRSS